MFLQFDVLAIKIVRSNKMIPAIMITYTAKMHVELPNTKYTPFNYNGISYKNEDSEF
jgi:hypothetical protein